MTRASRVSAVLSPELACASYLGLPLFDKEIDRFIGGARYEYAVETRPLQLGSKEAA
jgi:hypothetical protein